MMAGKTIFALSICIYGLYILFLSNSPNPSRNDLDKMAKFKYSGRQAYSNAENTESCYAFSAQAARLTKFSNVRCWYIIQTMGVKLVLKQRYLRRTLAFTPTSIATFNPIIYHLELTLQPLTGNHAAHCCPSFGLSDHNPTILVRKQNANLKSTKKAHFTVTYPPLKKLNADSLIKDLNEVHWNVLDTFDNDPDEMLSTWEALVLDVVDRHAPLKSVRVKPMKKPSWLSDQIFTAIKMRDRLKKELEKGRIQKVSFNAARNKVVRLIEKAKKEANKLNSRVLWKTLKSIFPTNVRQLSRINSVTKDGTSYTNLEEISNVFNEHFISIADNIIDKTINTEADLTSLVDFVRRNKAGNSTEFSIPTISDREVLEIIKSLPSNVATGLDGISPLLLKLIAPATAPSLTKVINCSIIKSICPAHLKLARVTPIYK